MFNNMPMYTGDGQFNMMPSYGNKAPFQNQMQNTMPYGYGMTNENPMPSQPSPISSLPPLFPSMLTPQLNPQAPFTSQNQMQARYAHGGFVHPRNMSDLAEMLREQGDEDDTILAHINPDEAHELAYHYGMDMNPHTGLPQFGRVKRFLKKGWKQVKKNIANVAPIVAPIVGNAIMPGLGGVLGGAIGKGVSNKLKHKNVGRGILQGAALGAGLGYGMPMLGRGLSAMGATNVGAGLSSIGGGQYGQGLGQLGKAIGIAGGAGALGGLGKGAGEGGYGLAQGAQEAAQAAERPGFLEGMLGKGGGLKDLLLPGALVGMAMRKEKMKPAYPQPSFENVAAQAGPQALRKMWGPEDQPRGINPFAREEEELDLAEALKGNEPLYHPAFYKGYAAGGYIHGNSGGQDDNVHKSIPENSYIVNATAVSHLGDGNSLAGAKKLDHFFQNLKHKKGLSGHYFHAGGTPHKYIDAMVSEGEYEIMPQDVQMLGNGDIKRGISMLNNLQKNVLSHKATHKLPPKAKSLTVYMRQRSKR